MIVTKKAISRRTVLRGLGRQSALPLLDAMIPALPPPRPLPLPCAGWASSTIPTVSSTINGCQRASAPTSSSRPRWPG